MKQPILTIRALELQIGDRKILRNLSMEIYPGEVVALVGRSGCGKSMTAHAILQLLPFSHRCSGEILYRQQDLLGLTPKEMRAIRGREIAMVFQEAQHALDPLMKVGKQVLEALPKERKTKDEVHNLFKKVGISDPVRRYEQYPHEFSGGMCQRVMIAMALASNPKLLIADEPTTALDVTIQAQIIDLLKSLQQEHNLAVLFITHDLGVVAEFSDRVYVMDDGEIVDSGITEYIFAESQHPFTKQLLEVT